MELQIIVRRVLFSLAVIFLFVNITVSVGVLLFIVLIMDSAIQRIIKDTGI